LDVLPFPSLAEDIENNINDLSKLIFSSHFTSQANKKIKNKRYDAVILGCTHYNFIKKQIQDHFRPLFVLGGEKKLVNELINFGLDVKSSVNYKRKRVSFLGECAKYNKNVCVKSGYWW
jgi:glutamate racemase